MTMKKKILSCATVALFALLLALPILFIRWTGGDVSDAENRTLAKMPTFFREDGSLNHEAYGETTRWLEDHIGFREQFVHLCSEIKFRLFRQSPSDRVQIGKDGWYYYTLDNNLQIATGEYPLTDELLEQILYTHVAIRDKLAERGIDYAVLLPVSKVSIYPEHLRLGDGQVHVTPVDTVADYLEAHSDLKVIRLKEALLAEKDSNQLYFKTDTHWTQMGAYVGYKQIVKQMQAWGLCAADPIQVDLTEASYTGEFGAMMGVSLGAEPTLNTVISDPKAVENPDPVKHRALWEAQEAFGFRGFNYFENAEADGPSVMLFGDSMFGGWNLSRLLSESFSSYVYIWDREIRNELLDAIQPDMVIYELTERFIDSIPSTNRAFLQNPLTNPSSAVLNERMDGSLLYATVRNTGAEAWRFLDQIKLTVFQNGADTGLRSQLPINLTVQPGEEYTFTVDLSPLGAEPANVTVQMCQEGVVYFGEIKAVGASQAQTGLDAEVVSTTLPETVRRGVSKPLTVTVKNTGTEPWRAADGIALCIWRNGQDGGYRMLLPENESVAPGESYPFTMDDFTLYDTEAPLLEFQMVQEQVQYFGEREAARYTLTD